MKSYAETQPQRSAIDALKGSAVLDFGTNWCGYCQAAAPLIEEALCDTATLQHIKVEDGPGRPLGRSFRVKLWPTLIFLREGREVARLVRPDDSASMAEALRQLGIPA